MAYSGAVLADSPALYLRLGEPFGTTTGYEDSSGNNRDGVYPGGFQYPTLGTTGLLTGDPNTAATFNAATTQRVSVPSASMPGGSTWGLNTATWEAWIKTSASPTYQQIITRDVSGGRQLQFRLQGGQLQCIIWNTSGTLVQANSTSTGLNNGVRHHVVAVYNGTDLRLYVDGLLDGTPVAQTGNLANSSGDLHIAVRDLLSEPYTGVIDEVAVYTTALSATRVAAHHAAGITDPVAGLGRHPIASRFLQSWEQLYRSQAASAMYLVASNFFFGSFAGVARAALTATSTLSVTVAAERPIAAALSATGTLTTSAVQVTDVAAALSAASTLAITPVETIAAVTPLTAVGTLVADIRSRNPLGVSGLAPAPLASTFVEWRNLYRTDSATAIEPVTTHFFFGTVDQQSVVALLAQSTLTVAVESIRETPAALTATSTLTVDAIISREITVGLTATSTLATALTVLVEAALTASATLTTDVVLERPFAAALTATATLGVAVVFETPVATALTVTATLTVAITGGAVSIAASLDAVATLSVVQELLLEAALTSVATLVVEPVVEVFVLINLTAMGVLQVAVDLRPPLRAVIAMVATSTLTVSVRLISSVLEVTPTSQYQQAEYVPTFFYQRS